MVGEGGGPGPVVSPGTRTIRSGRARLRLGPGAAGGEADGRLELESGLAWLSAPEDAGVTEVRLMLPEGSVGLRDGEAVAILVRPSGQAVVGSVRGRPVVTGADNDAEAVSVPAGAVASVGVLGARLLAGHDPTDLISYDWLDLNLTLDEQDDADRLGTEPPPVLAAAEPVDQPPAEPAEPRGAAEEPAAQDVSAETPVGTAAAAPDVSAETPAEAVGAAGAAAGVRKWGWAAVGMAAAVAVAVLLAFLLGGGPGTNSSGRVRVAGPRVAPVAPTTPSTATPAAPAAPDTLGPGTTAADTPSTTVAPAAPASAPAATGPTTAPSARTLAPTTSTAAQGSTTTTLSSPPATAVASSSAPGVTVTLGSCSHPPGALEMSGSVANKASTAQRVSIRGRFVDAQGNQLGSGATTVTVPSGQSKPWTISTPYQPASSGRCQVTGFSSTAA